MKIVLYIIALLWIAAGTFVVVFTDKAMGFLERTLRSKDLRRLSVLPFLFGSLLIVGAFYQKGIFWFILSLGLLAVFKGVYLVKAPPEQSKALMDWWFSKARPETVRVMGLVLLVLGITLFSYLR